MRARNIIPKFLGKLIACSQGGVTTLACLALPVLIGSAGLAVDLNRGYQQRIINQRAADLGALAAAIAFQNASDAAILTPTARDVAVANGLIGATVAATLVNDRPNAGDQAVRVTVNQQLPYTLASVLGMSGNFNVAADSMASLSGGKGFAAPCYLALDGGKAAISVTGGASIDAPNCSIAAIGEIENKGQLIRGADIISGSSDIYVNYGELDAGTLRFAGSFSKPQWNNAVPPPEDRINEATPLSDPWANNPDRVAAMALLGNFTAAPALSDPNTPNGSDWKFNWNPTGTVAGFRQGTSGNYIVPAGVYNIKKFEVAGGINVTFEDGSIIRVRQGVSVGGGSNVDFGDGDVYVNGGFDSGSNGVTFGDGALWIGSGQVRFQGTNRKGDGDVLINADLSLGGGQHLVMGDGDHYFGGLDIGGGGTARLGEGDIGVANGIRISGNSELAIGDGDIVVGPGNGNRAIFLSGSARFFMGDGQFSANGDIDTAGGSRLVFGRTANHYINGDMKIAGSVLFGAGRYTINGDFENGTGGTTWPYTSSLTGKTYGSVLEGESVSGYDMAGINVTFVLAGTIKLAGGAKTKLEAADYTQAGGFISELLLTTESSDDANWTGGSLNTFAGTLHLPNAQVKMAGGNSTSTTKCMTLIANTIRVNGGAATGSACTMMDDLGGSGSNTTVRLIG